MSQLTPSPVSTPDVSRQLTELTEAVNRLAAAQQSQPANAPGGQDVGGELPGGEALAPGVDYASLSPVQQIALGLRDARPVGPNALAATHVSASPPGEEERPRAGAD